jgi:hypothetical protein
MMRRCARVLPLTFSSAALLRTCCAICTPSRRAPRTAK